MSVSSRVLKLLDVKLNIKEFLLVVFGGEICTLPSASPPEQSLFFNTPMVCRVRSYESTISSHKLCIAIHSPVNKISTCKKCKDINYSSYKLDV